jgi:hypothetical protein
VSTLGDYGNTFPMVLRQRVVSAEVNGAHVPEDEIPFLRRLIGGHPDAPGEVLDLAADSTSAPLLVAAAIVAGDSELLIRAAQHAITTRDRQLVTLAGAHLRGDAELLDALVRDHLSEHPDNLLAAWIAGRALPGP